MQVEQPLFTIATITYNSRKWIRQAIESVLCSSYTDFEYLISDDCSNDDTWDIIEEYNDVRIGKWKINHNIGEYPNRKMILSKASGKFILFIDGDDVLYKNSLRNLSEYITAFPTLGMIWGVSTSANMYVIPPYLFKPETTLKLLYSDLYHLGVIGFTETVFNVEALKKMDNDFPLDLSTGDPYIRKKLALTENVLFIPLGISFWRSSSTQASSRLSQGFKGMLEGYKIDMKILNDNANPLSVQDRMKALQNIKISVVKRLIRYTLLKLNFVQFFKIYKCLKLSFKDLLLLFKRIDNRYLPIKDISEPLANKYNFK